MATAALIAEAEKLLDQAKNMPTPAPVKESVILVSHENCVSRAEFDALMKRSDNFNTRCGHRI